ncbi:MAG: tRNA (N6-isopentenyl adenosine(37)-C2)-methylthiotransferase MiaB [Armatimonadetes bacterium]|nr:tRNA (N6-isopentenyl adenosine(37)-C2)-methylthiotransferase MiaB [Armatimonadota bacterium]
MARKLYIETYGCQMNVADSQLIAGSLHDVGYVTTDTPADADVILVNTCAIRENAETRVWGRLADLAREKRARPWVTLGLVGCMAQHLRDKIQARAPEVDLVVGPDAYRRLGDILLQDRDEPFVDVRLDKHERYEGLDPRSDNGLTAFVTVMRGCDKFCTFCIVPFVRGRERSLSLDEVLRSVRALVDDGVREVTLLGQTVNAWRDGEHDFADLLRAVDTIPGLRRIRFTSPHPAPVDDRLVAAMAECDKVMPSLHLPLQAASDAVLERMSRGYTYGDYLRRVERLRAAIPGLALTTDLIVGFPGETEAQFACTLAAVDEVQWDSAFMFQYSPRSGTKAYEWADDVPAGEKARRLQAVIERQEAVSAERNRDAVGRVFEVMTEGTAKRGGGWYGRTPQFKNTVYQCELAPAMGEMVPVRVTSCTAHTLLGEAVVPVGAAG